MLTSKQRAFLSGLAAGLDPVIHLGKQGPEAGLVKALDQALLDHELVKVRFVDYKDSRRDIALELAEAVHAELVRVIGRTAVLYRKSTNPEKQHISLP